MTTYFIRGLFVYGNPAARGYYYAKQLALFLKNIVGYTFQSQSVTSGDFTSTEKSGTGASVTGSSWVLTGSGTPFASSDAGKFIFIKDASHPENSGVFPIIEYLSTSTIKVDWLGTDSEYPTASSTISWWIAADSYEAPITNGDYVRLQSPHSTGWALQIKTKSDYNDAGAYLSVAVDGNWSGGKIIGEAAVTLDYIAKHHSYGYAIATDDGSSLVCFRQWLDGLVTLGGLVGIIEPIETGRQSYELIGLAHGGDPGVFYVPNISRDTNQTWGIGNGIVRVWSDKLNQQVDCRMGSYTAAGYKTSMPYPKTSDAATIWRENNPRVGNRMEVMYGTPIFHENTDNSFPPYYSIVGILGGHWTTRGDLPRCQGLSTDGTKWDRIHIGYGIVVEWAEDFTPREIVPMKQIW